MRKTLAIVLSAIMLLGILTLGISAETEGTAINSAADFAAMTEDGTYYLNTDIAISVPYAKVFTGKFDGNGHTVTVSNCAMFDIIDGATISNLKILGNIAVTNASAAALAVRAVSGATVINVTTEVNVSVTGARQGLYAAGLIATTNVVKEDNEMYYDNKQPENKTDAMLTFINCKNTGDISVVLEGIPAELTAEQKLDEKLWTGEKVTNYAIVEGTVKPRAGGLNAVGQNYICVDCENTGNVTALGASSSIAGGISARPGLSSTAHSWFFINCKNSGDVVSNSYSGGICGYINGGSGSQGTCVIYGCFNSGKITGPTFCGGMVGYMWASGSTSYMDMAFCVNTGKLVYARPANAEGNAQTSYVSGWIAYTNSTSTTVRYCIDYADREVAEGALEYSNAIIAISSADPMSYWYEFNYLVDPTGYVKEYSHGNNADNQEARGHLIDEAGDRVTVLANDDIIKSGEVAYTCNTEADGLNAWYSDFDPAEVNRVIEYYQKLGTEAYPTCEVVEENYVMFDGTKYYNGKKGEEPADQTTPEQTTEDQGETTTAAQEPETTTAAQGGETTTAAQGGETTTAAPKTEKKGCGSFAAAGVVVVAVLGAAFVAKKKF